MRRPGEKKEDGVWKVLNRNSGNYVGAYPTRAAARNAGSRVNLTEAEVAMLFGDQPEQKENTLLPSGDPLQSPADSGMTPDNLAQEAKTMKITLRKRNVEKSGNVAYAREGVRSSVYFNKLMFSPGAPLPDEITIEGPDGAFAEPGEVKAGIGGGVITPERAAKIQQEAEKAALRAQKAAERAQKLAARAAKLVPPAAE